MQCLGSSNGGIICGFILKVARVCLNVCPFDLVMPLHLFACDLDQVEVLVDRPKVPRIAFIAYVESDRTNTWAPSGTS